ncbi:MAG: DUF817 domain-containing protein [Hyphomonadaceae bacterium]|nr:DUF817 domain-containing protein [Hyphomonadaceae bacterium]
MSATQFNSRANSRVDETLARLLPLVERGLNRGLPSSLTQGLIEFLVFGIKQAWACLFGGLLLAGMIVTHLYYPDAMPLARYDFLVAYAVSIQILFLITKLERPSEALVILIFHLVGTVMEVFKTDVGSWVYPEENVLRIGGVPLFSGFMYAAVGSYFARCARVFEFRWTNYPRLWMTLILAFGIYVNFFSHHFTIDIRYGLFALTALIFWRCRVYYRVWRWQHQMPLLLGFFLVAVFIWLAENIATFTQIWLYPNQETGWHMVSLQKLGSWYLLMIISWVLVTLVHRPKGVRDH